MNNFELRFRRVMQATSVLATIVAQAPIKRLAF